LGGLYTCQGGLYAPIAGGGGGVISVSAADSTIIVSPSPITTTGTVGVGIVPLSKLAAQAADTVVMNASVSSAAPTAVSVPGCFGASNALIYNNTTHAWGCNTIAAGSSSFSAITSGTNAIPAAMLVGNGSTLGYTGTGQVNANVINAASVPAKACGGYLNAFSQFVGLTCISAAAEAGGNAGAMIANAMAEPILVNGGVVDTAGINGGVFSSAIFATITQPINLILDPGIWNVNITMTWPKNITVTFRPGALITIHSADVLSWVSPINAPVTQQIFTTPIGGTLVWKVAAQPMSVGWLGAVGNDVADDSAAFVAADAIAQTSARVDTSPSSDGNFISSVKTYIPNGTYLITQNQAFMSSSYTTGTTGRTFFGDGPSSVLIDYRPATSGPLLYNNNAWVGVEFDNMEFTCNDLNSDFIDSTSAGHAQAVHTNEVWFKGTWKYLFNLFGSNNNSENTFRTTRIAGSYIAVLYSPPVTGAVFSAVPNAGGTGYVVGDVVTTACSTTSASLKVATVSSGVVTKLYLVPGGQGVGCTGATGAATSGGTGTGLTVNTTTETGVDQFLNQWWTDLVSAIQGGNFVDMTTGGHINFERADWSELTGTTNPTILFALRGTSHGLGNAFFSCTQCRVELAASNVSVMYSTWGSYGSVLFSQLDLSPYAGVYSDANTVMEFNMQSASGAAAYHIVDSFIIGQIKIDNTNTDYGYRKYVTVENTQFHEEDYTKGFAWGAFSGANWGALASVDCIRCRGNNASISLAYTHWASSTAYTIGAQRWSNNYVYQATSSGTSGSTAPNGRTTSFNDGGVTWTTLDVYNGTDYAESGSMKNSNAAFIAATNGAGGVYSANIGYLFGDNQLPIRQSASVPGLARLILPPNSTVVEIDLYVTPSGTTQATTGTFVLTNANYTPTVFTTQPFNPLSAGGSLQYVLPVPYNTGTDIGSRTIVVQANTDVNPGGSAVPGWAIVKYF
jgi:hypothetical protein